MQADPGEQRQGRSVKRLTDPRALRALAHPIRLSLLGLLRTEGPLTATRAGALLGESSASCSFHLRQLARYGLAEAAEGGQGRERPWQATAMFTSVEDVADSPEFAAASGLFRSVLAQRYFDDVTRWLDARPNEPAEWQRAVPFGDTFLYLTADELADLSERAWALVERYLERQQRPELRPQGARLVRYLHVAFPVVDRGTGKKGAGDNPSEPGGPAR